jgi:hypothetical protein
VAGAAEAQWQSRRDRGIRKAAVGATVASHLVGIYTTSALERLLCSPLLQLYATTCPASFQGLRQHGLVRMGNCQAAEAAAVVLQHPGGRVERLYWSTSAAEVMRANPGHYVALVTLRVAEERHDAADGERRTVRLTRVKLLKPKEMLLLGHAYRLITTQRA